MPRGGSDIVTIYWRDIPTQVNGQAGRERHQVLLSSKFQRAVDRAKRKAGIYTAHEDIAQWRRESKPLVGDIREAAELEANRIEVEFSREFLGRLAYAGGFIVDMEANHIPVEELAALEELEDDDDYQTLDFSDTTVDTTVETTVDTTTDSPAPDITSPETTEQS